jgi:hypothetical protein
MFFKEPTKILQNIQDSIQARKCKIPIKELKKRMVSTEKDENQCQDRQYNSDDEFSDFEDAESTEVYDDDELDKEDWNDEMDKARCLNDLKKGEELSANKTIDSRQLGEQSIFHKDNNPEGTTNGQEHYQELEDMNQDSRILADGSSRYKTLLAFVSGASIGNTFSDDDETPPPSHEIIDNSIDLNKDTSLDANDWMTLGLQQRNHSFHEKHC